MNLRLSVQSFVREDGQSLPATITVDGAPYDAAAAPKLEEGALSFGVTTSLAEVGRYRCVVRIVHKERRHFESFTIVRSMVEHDASIESMGRVNGVSGSVVASAFHIEGCDFAFQFSYSLH